MLVFAAHVGLGERVPVLAGDLGVTIFFFLSGFIITTLLRLEFEKSGAVKIGYFWLRRALRILPPFFLVVAAATLLALVLYPPGTVDLPTMRAELLFYANYWGICCLNREAPGTGVVWSLAVEEHFYLLFPLLYTAMQRYRMTRRRQALLLWGLCGVVLVWRCVLVLKLHAASPRIFLATDTRVDAILFGCALAVWNNPALDPPGRFPPKFWKYLLLPAALGTLVASVLLGGLTFKTTWYFSLQGLALTCLFQCAVRYPTWLPFRFLNWWPVILVGTLSYSLYLVHDVLLRAAGQLWPNHHGGQRAIMALGASIAVAWMIHAFVERPCARLRKRFTREGLGERRGGLRVTV